MYLFQASDIAEQINKLNKKIETASSIVIVTHFNPDGDALGSSLGLHHVLKQLGKKCTVIIPNAFPDFLAFLPGSDKVVNFEMQTKKAQGILGECDLLYCLDFNSLTRVNKMEDELRKCNATKVLIDHHQQPEDFADFSFSDTQYGSTCQMIFDYLNVSGYGELINQPIADCLYTGVITDSGQFKHRGTNARTHEVAAALINAGARNTEIPQLLFDNQTHNRLKLLGYCLYEKLTVLADFHTAFISLSKEELDRFNYQKGDTEGVVNYALSVMDIKLAAFFVERDGAVKISFRSKGKFDVNKLAREHFKGGGHINAAGGQSDTTMDETISHFMEVIQSLKQELLEAQ
jgi:bifunctional oligoribonuclease and PAP phosphatase NrnA